MAYRFFPAAVISAVFLIVSACAGSGSVGKERLNAELNIPDAYEISADGGVYSSRWWEIFGSSELNALMDRMQSENYQIAGSYEEIKALYSALGITSADRLPSVDAEVQASEAYSTDSSGERRWRDSYELSLTASYEADIWGRIKAGTQSDIYQILSGRHTLDALYTSLSAELADRYFLYKSLANIQKLQKEQLELRQKQISAQEMMYSSGVGALDTVYVKQTAMADLLESITETRQNMKDARIQIALILGESDSASFEITDEYDFDIPFLPEVIPADVAESRPDIRAAYASVLRIDRDKAQAMADRYPKLSFSASAGYSSDAVSSLVSPDSFVASLVGNLVMPVFDAKTKKLQVERQEHLLAAEIYNYYETVITALHEVGSALEDNLQKERALYLSEEKVRIEEKRLKIAEAKYEMGIGDYSDVIDNKISLLSGWIDDMNARRLLISARIELARASGGGYAQNMIEGRLGSLQVPEENK